MVSVMSQQKRSMQPRAYDLVSVPPAPLMRNAWLSGRFYRVADGGWLPVGMRFGVEKLPWYNSGAQEKADSRVNSPTRKDEREKSCPRHKKQDTTQTSHSVRH